MTPTDAANAIKQSVTMRACAERYGFNPNRAGFICCPFHQEKTPSLKCYDGARGFACYGCGEHGSVIDFVQRMFGLNFWQAVTRLDADFGLNLPLGRTVTLRERREAAIVERARRMEIARRKRAAEDAENAYLMWLAWWLLTEQIATQEAPKQPSDEMSDLWVFAMKERTFALESLEIAEMKRMKHAGH